jgi:hypothetical protein
MLRGLGLVGVSKGLGCPVASAVSCRAQRGRWRQVGGVEASEGRFRNNQAGSLQRLFKAKTRPATL